MRRHSSILEQVVRLVAVLLGVAQLCALAFGAAPVRVPGAEAIGSAVVKLTPAKPLFAQQLKICGAVEVDVTIDERGAVEKAELLRGNPILGKAAQETVKKWKFKPFKQGDTAIRAIATLVFEFK